MKRVILMMTLMAFLGGATLALADGSSGRFAIDRAWKSVEAWQKVQDQRFKAAETDLAGTSMAVTAAPSLPSSGAATYWPVTAAGASDKAKADAGR